MTRSRSVRLAAGLLAGLGACAPAPKPEASHPASRRDYVGVAIVEGHAARPGQLQEHAVWMPADVVTSIQTIALGWSNNPAAEACTAPPGALTCRQLCEDSECRVVHSNGDQVTLVERRFTHPRLGDVVDSFEFSNEGVNAQLHELDHGIALELSTADEHPAGDPLRLDGILSARQQQADAVALSPLEVEWIEPGRLGRVRIESQQFGVPFVVTPGGTIVVEAPLSSRLTQRVLELIETKTNTSVVIGVITHHHPHHAGGIRALVAHGVTIYGTAVVEDWARQAVAQSRSYTPDRLAQHPKELMFLRVDGEREVDVADTTLRLVDLGPASRHTDEHLVAAIDGWLIVGDLFPPPSVVSAAATERRRQLKSALDERALGGTTLQAWPLADPIVLGTTASP